MRHGYFHAGTYSSFRQRRHGRPLDTATIPATRLLAYTSDHDQVGNRAVGDRPSQNLDFGQLAVKAALVLASPYTAMLFMGEEWGSSSPFQFFTSHPEPELARATAEGRKAEFAGHGWDADEIPDPQDPETFARSKLEWDEIDTGDHARLGEVYRALIAPAPRRARLRRPVAGPPAHRLRRGPAVDRRCTAAPSRSRATWARTRSTVPVRGDVVLASAEPTVGECDDAAGHSFAILRGDALGSGQIAVGRRPRLERLDVHVGLRIRSSRPS